jgi:hypothetical protein
MPGLHLGRPKAGPECRFDHSNRPGTAVSTCKAEFRSFKAPYISQQSCATTSRSALAFGEMRARLAVEMNAVGRVLGKQPLQIVSDDHADTALLQLRHRSTDVVRALLF